MIEIASTWDSLHTWYPENSIGTINADGAAYDFRGLISHDLTLIRRDFAVKIFPELVKFLLKVNDIDDRRILFLTLLDVLWYDDNYVTQVPPVPHVRLRDSLFAVYGVGPLETFAAMSDAGFAGSLKFVADERVGDLYSAVV